MMRKVFKSRRFWGAVGFVFLLVAIVVIGWLYGRYTHSKRLTAPSSSVTALRNNVNQAYLAATSLRDADGSLETTPTTLIALQNSLKTSLETSKELLKKHQDSLSKDAVQRLGKALDTQEQLLADYSSRYQILGKAISYNPSLDLEISDNEKIIQRATAAQTNLSQLADRQDSTLPTEARDSLRAISRCFGQVADTAQKNQTSQLAEIRSRCIRNYSLVRAGLVTSLLVPYTSADNENTLRDLQDIIQKL